MIRVTLCENHSGIYPPICKMITRKNICIINCDNNSILILGGNTRYCPPIVNSPNGRPHNRRKLNIITIAINTAPIIATISHIPSFFYNSGEAICLISLQIAPAMAFITASYFVFFSNKEVQLSFRRIGIYLNPFAKTHE